MLVCVCADCWCVWCVCVVPPVDACALLHILLLLLLLLSAPLPCLRHSQAARQILGTQDLSRLPIHSSFLPHLLSLLLPLPHSARASGHQRLTSPVYTPSSFAPSRSSRALPLCWSRLHYRCFPPPHVCFLRTPMQEEGLLRRRSATGQIRS